MTDLHVTTGILGVGLAAGILYLVRRDHLYLRDGLFWLGVALAALALGLMPRLVDHLGQLAGIAYSPALVLALGIVVLLVKALYTDIRATGLRRDLRRLNQKLTMIEFEMERDGERRIGIGENARKPPVFPTEAKSGGEGDRERD